LTIFTFLCSSRKEGENWVPVWNTIEELYSTEDESLINNLNTYMNPLIDSENKLSENYSDGITSHQFLMIGTNDFGISGNTVTLDYTGTLAMTDNIIVADLRDITYIDNYYVVLPNGDASTSGARVRVILKNLIKYF
jgi:hypothetical protein